jgi:hypothetical protein
MRSAWDRNLYAQTRINILRCDGALMQSHRALCNGQTKPNSTAPFVPSFLDAKERFDKFGLVIPRARPVRNPAP